MRYEWLDEHADEIVTRYVDRGESMREIADAFGVSAPTIRRRLVEHDAPIRNGGPRYTWLDDCVDEMVERYTDREESLRTIADAYGVTPDAIKRRLREADVELRSPNGELVDLGFSPHHVSIITGELLGDGCLYQRESGSCFFQLSNTVRAHPRRIAELLPADLFPDGQPYSVTRTDGLGDGATTNWIVSSRLQPIFQTLYEDWYEPYDGRHRKVVPEDYALDETALLHWYWGDGSCSLRESGAPRICFATHGFPEASVERLQAELERLGFENYTVFQKGVENGSGLMIRLRDRASRAFLERLRPRNTLPAYEYKFPVSEPVTDS